MKLYELLQEINVQGGIKVKDFTGDKDGETVYEQYDHLDNDPIDIDEEILAKEVTYIYSEKDYTICGTEVHLVIEVKGEEE